MNDEYSAKMLKAFIGKEDKTLWYQLSFSKYTINTIPIIRWNWSWWAFFGGFLFLLYRKQYLPSAVLFFLTVTIGMLPFMGFILAILAGGYATYFIYKGYNTKLLEIESHIENEDTRIETMEQLGGTHQWVVWVYAFFVSLVLFGLVSMSIIPSLAL